MFSYVTCDACSKKHLVDNNTFITIVGDVYVGRSIVVVEDSFDQTTNVSDVHIFCLTCFLTRLHRATSNPTTIPHSNEVKEI